MLKVTFLFQQTNGETKLGRTCGWSETWYRDAPLTGDPNGGTNYAKRRAGFLTRSAAIIGARIQEIGGGSRVTKFIEVGSIGTDSDIPQMALNVGIPSVTSPYKRTIQLRGIPDSRVQFGDYIPSQAFQANFTAWATTMGAENWRFQALDRTQPRVKIFAIDAMGNVQCAAGATINIGDQVIVRNCRSTTGVSVNGKYFVESKVDNSNFKIRGFPALVVGVKGTIAKVAFTYAIVDGQNYQILGATTRKVGRPFFQFRGRQAKSA